MARQPVQTDPIAATAASQVTVRAAVIELLRSLGLTTIFGNPGSTELPMFRDFPDDFRYVTRAARIRRDRHGRWLRASYAQRGADQPAFRGWCRSRDGQHLHGLQESHAARDHGGAAGALDPAVRAVPVLVASHRSAETLRQMGQRAGTGRRRTCCDRTRLPHRNATAVRADARVDTRGRLGSTSGARCAPIASRMHCAPILRRSRRSASPSIAANGPCSSWAPRSIGMAHGTRSSRSPSAIKRSSG